MKRAIVVTGVGGPAGRATAEYFARRGYRVVGTDIRDVPSPAAVHRLVPPASDPRFPAALLDVAEQEGAGMVVPTVTEELPIVARMRGAFRARSIALAASDPRGVDVAGDKLLTAERLGAGGIHVPATFPAGTSAGALVLSLGFPMLSKPRFGRGGRGVLVHHCEEDLSRVERAEVVWQAFLPGEEFDLNLFVERDGSAPAAVALRKTSLREGIVGNALGVDRVDRPDVVALGVSAARALGLEGPLDVDIRLGFDGAPAVLEVNARVGANVLSAPEVLDALHQAWESGRCD